MGPLDGSRSATAPGQGRRAHPFDRLRRHRLGRRDPRLRREPHGPGPDSHRRPRANRGGDRMPAPGSGARQPDPGRRRRGSDDPQRAPPGRLPAGSPEARPAPRDDGRGDPRAGRPGDRAPSVLRVHAGNAQARHHARPPFEGSARLLGRPGGLQPLHRGAIRTRRHRPHRRGAGAAARGQQRRPHRRHDRRRLHALPRRHGGGLPRRRSWPGRRAAAASPGARSARS